MFRLGQPEPDDRPPVTRRTLFARAAGLGFIAFAALILVARPKTVALAFGLDASPWTNHLFDGGLAVAMLSLIFCSVELLRSLHRSLTGLSCGAAPGARTQPRLAGERGTVMVEFAMVLPIVLLVLGMVIQLGLLANASIVVRYSAFAAARTGIVSFERGHLLSVFEELDGEAKSDIRKSSRLILAAISPHTRGRDDDAAAIFRILDRQGKPWGDWDNVGRMTYATAASTIDIDDGYADANPLAGFSTGSYQINVPTGGISALGPVGDAIEDVIQSVLGSIGSIGLPNVFAPKEIEVTVTYDYLITIPGISLLPFVTKDAPAGVSGRVFTITQTVKLQSTGARAGSPMMFVGGSPL